MPRTSDMIPSRSLKKEDIGVGVLWTIRGVEQVNFAKDDEEAELKWVLHFDESEKGLTLNVTNIRTLETICGDDTDVWRGKQVVLYWDSTVQYKGKPTGGIRIRAPKSQAEKDLPF